MIDLIKVLNKMQVKLFRDGNNQFLRHLPVRFVIFSDLKVKLNFKLNFKEEPRNIRTVWTTRSWDRL